MPYSNEDELVEGKKRVQVQVSTYPKGSPRGEWLVSGPHTTSRFECPFIEYSHHQISTDGKIHLATSECNRTVLSLLGPHAHGRRASYGFGALQKRRFSCVPLRRRIPLRRVSRKNRSVARGLGIGTGNL